MRRASLRATCLLATLLFLPALVACEFKSVTVQIADFETNSVEGVRFWRLDEALGDFQPGGSVRFSDPYPAGGGLEMIDYTIVQANGEEVLTLPAEVIRDPADPDLVTLVISYGRFEEAGWFRVSSFNAVGDSELSSEQVYL